jgi:hypothetical protein
MATPNSAKVLCINPNTGGKMNIDKDIYDLFVTAISQVLKNGKRLTYTELAEGVSDYIHLRNIDFNKSVGWYTVVVKNDLEARKAITVFTEKGKKLHKL